MDSQVPPLSCSNQYPMVGGSKTRQRHFLCMFLGQFCAVFVLIRITNTSCGSSKKRNLVEWSVGAWTNIQTCLSLLLSCSCILQEIAGCTGTR